MDRCAGRRAARQNVEKAIKPRCNLDIPDPTNPENLLKANGRGILFMNAFMDEVSWSNHQTGGMVVKMVKKR